MNYLKTKKCKKCEKIGKVKMTSNKKSFRGYVCDNCNYYFSEIKNKNERRNSKSNLD